MPKQLAVLVLLMVSFGTACNRQLTDADATDSFKKFLVSDLAESNARRGPEHASVGRPTLGADGKRYWSRCYIDRIKDYTVDVPKNQLSDDAIHCNRVLHSGILLWTRENKRSRGQCRH